VTDALAPAASGGAENSTPARLQTLSAKPLPEVSPQMQKAVAVLMSFLLVLTTFPVGASAQNASASGAQDEYRTLSAEELDAIVAPIALYLDALVAQILGAGTFPYEIVNATLWLKDKSELKG
jgi:hypothetical protein